MYALYIMCAFIRKIKKGNSTYLARVESYRKEGRVKQRVLEYLGKEINGTASKKIYPSDIEIISSKQYLDYKILYDLALELKIDQVIGAGFEYILLIVLSQIVSRRSLYKLPEHHEQTCLLEILKIKTIDNKTLYKTLDKIQELDFRLVENSIFNNFKEINKEKDAMLIDVTDTYFSGSQADWKRRKGKDGKISKLVQIALAVTKKYVFPIMHKTYEGNISNIKIFEEMISDIRLLDFYLIIMDRGMTCYETLNDLKKLSQSVITGIKLSEKLKVEFLDKVEREDIYQPSNRVILKNTEVFIKTFRYLEGNLVVIYNPELETVKKHHAMRDEEKYSLERAKYLGYSLLYNSSSIEDKEAVKFYFEKDVIEKSYKEIKGSVNLHPIRKYLLNHVQAHIKICYLSYSILSLMQYKLRKMGISSVEALRKLEPVHKVSLESKDGKIKWSKTVTLSREQQKIIQTLNCSV